jgi:hypothetical protein
MPPRKCGDYFYVLLHNAGTNQRRHCLLRKPTNGSGVRCSDLLDDISDPVIRFSPAADRHIAAKNQVFHATAP